MHSTTTTLTLLAVTAFTVGCGGSTSQSNQQTQRAVQQIELCPPWSKVRSDQSAQQENIFACLENIAALDTTIIRKGMEQFVLKMKNEGKWDVSNMSKLFVMNRYLFDVPAELPLKQAKFFGGWRGVPRDDRAVNMLWPLEKNSDGRIIMAGDFAGYVGEAFDPIREFDYFDDHFGRRQQ
jgi:hypothetical protein